MKFTIVHVGLGGNLPGPDEARANLAAVVERLKNLNGVAFEAASSVYETEPLGNKDQPWFVNQVVRLRVDGAWTPERFLAVLNGMETCLGRERTGDRYGPRCIDVDLLDFGGQELHTDELTLPHPRMEERAFVLVPLAEITPDFRLPGSTPVQRALEKLKYRVNHFRIFQE